MTPDDRSHNDLLAEVERLREQRDGASEYVRESLERLAQTADVPITDADGPRANFYLVDDIEAEIRRLRAENARLLAGVADWLRDIGYPYDWTTDLPLPELLRRPLAEAWYRQVGVTVDYFLIALADEGAW